MRLKSVHVRRTDDCGSRISPAVWEEDSRGFFLKPHLISRGARDIFVTVSRPGVLRGMHILTDNSTKILMVVSGSIRDVICQKYSNEVVHATVRTLEPGDCLLIPGGSAHGFLVQGRECATILYASSKPYSKKNDVGYSALSPQLAVFWGGSGIKILSNRDKELPSLDEWILDWDKKS